MANKNPTTRQPSGLKTVRDGLRFVFSWKISDVNYGGGQQLKWRHRTGAKWGAWTDIAVSTVTVAKAVTFSASDYWPTAGKPRLFDVEFAVRGKRSPVTQDDVTTTYDWSAWTYLNTPLYAPRMPSLTEELDSQADNKTTFSWSVDADSADNAPFSGVEWQSILVKESDVTDGAKLKWDSSNAGWQTNTSSSASSSKEITEETTLLAANSYTRWFRIRSRGVGGHKWSQGGNNTGCSYWRYAKHVYAMPNAPVINKVQRDGTLQWIKTYWTAPSSASHPIDLTTVEYAIDTPAAAQTVPSSPSPTWTEALSFADTAGIDAAHFLVGTAVGLDQCMWVRVSVAHDRNSRPSMPKLAMSGALTAPTNLSVTTDTSTHKATITATNNSAVPDSRLAVIFRREGHKDVVIAVIAHGQTTASGVQCPNWGSDNIAFGVYAFQGTASAKESGSAGTVTTYAINANMVSDELWDGGAVPSAPTGVTADATGTEGEVLMTWNWSWRTANRAEISWSENPNAWESTDEPSTYTVTNIHAAKWRVSGLTVGKKYYFRIRLARETADGITYGPYSGRKVVDLSSPPDVPVLSLSKAVVPKRGKFAAVWTYSSTDGSRQAYAEICSATVSGSTITYGKVIAHTKTAQKVTVQAPTNWNNGETHWVCGRVRSSSGKTSDWSDPVPIAIASPITCTISATSLTNVTVDEGTSEERTVRSLTAMPLTATITGAGEGGTTMLLIERLEEYHVIRPDETVRDGFKGETIAVKQQTGAAQMSIGRDDLVGLFDDGGVYLLTATVEDGYGQTDSKRLRFEVHWSHQSTVPLATVTMLSDGAAKIALTKPDGAAASDKCDIYRLTADKPQLIYTGAAWSYSYVDPYPAIGDHGYRVVCVTENGDYIAGDTPAWVDKPATLAVDYGIIDFGDYSMPFRYNTKVSSSWSKDFKQTRYLGGSIRGDWNAGVSRSATISAVVVASDTEEFRVLRRLADYDGICHVRTPEGSSYAADVQVGESMGFDTAGKLANVTLAVTRVDPEQLDGVTYSEWINS